MCFFLSFVLIQRSICKRFSIYVLMYKVCLGFVRSVLDKEICVLNPPLVSSVLDKGEIDLCRHPLFSI